MVIVSLSLTRTLPRLVAKSEGSGFIGPIW